MPKTHTGPARIAVLTGDVVESRRVSDRPRLYRWLDDSLATLAQRHGGRAERFRGDGFQLALPHPGQALAAAVALRAALIQHSEPEQRWDARIAIAVGPARWQPDQRLADADEPPFVQSGLALDALGQSDERLALVPGPHDDGSLALLLRYLDALIDGWSRYSAEVVGLSLAGSPSQQAMAERLGIRQPSVHKRLRAARWALLVDTLAHFEARLGDGSTAE
ncbi:hypothetical protein [Halomonas sp. E14]|uniref:hypothetical protein n=1 Tax=Halomonas sp. E14 TaxID=3397245 RepID=UPI00403EDCE8